MNDVVIGAIRGYKWSQVSCWVNSLNRSGYRGDKVMIVYDTEPDVVEKLEASGFKVIKENINPESEVHNVRFKHIAEHLQSNRSKYRYVITSDVRDVIFQYDPTVWLEDNMELTGSKLALVSEGILFKNEEWGKYNVIEAYGQNSYDSIKDCLIINSGVISGHVNAMIYLLSEMSVFSVIGKARLKDQAALNIIIRNNDAYKDISYISKACDGYACIMGTTCNSAYSDVTTDPYPVFKDGKVYNSNGDKFAIVHQYDRVEGIREEIYAKYWES